MVRRAAWLCAPYVARLSAWGLAVGFFLASTWVHAAAFGPQWGSAPTGPYPPAPGVTHWIIDTPDGKPPSLADLASLRYHHHMRTAVDTQGRVWVAYSGNLTNEDQSGEITEIISSTTRWATRTGPLIAVQPPSAFSTAIFPGMRISYPRAFLRHAGQLYLVAAIDEKADGGDSQTGLALIGLSCNPDGTLGRPFLVSPASGYKPLPGYPAYAYNPVLGPALFADANRFGSWGGSQIGFPPSAWVGFATDRHHDIFVEPSTVALSADRKQLLRLWRQTKGADQNRVFSSSSHDGGKTWSPIVKTSLPNQPSETTIVKLANGHIAVIGNAQGQARDPLYVATFDGTTGAPIHIYAVISGATAPAYRNGQTLGFSYPGADESHGVLWISYSINKQQVGVAALPSASL
jgi:hypothetical protein